MTTYRAGPGNRPAFVRREGGAAAALGDIQSKGWLVDVDVVLPVALRRLTDLA